MSSGLPLKADIAQCSRHVSKVPQGDITSLLNQLVRASKDARRQLKAERLGGLEVDDHLEFRWLLHWKIGRLGTPENLVDVVSGAPRRISNTWPIGDEAAGCHKFPNSMKRRQLLPSGEFRDALSMITRERVFDRNQRIPGAALSQLRMRYRSRPVLAPPRIEPLSPMSDPRPASL